MSSKLIVASIFAHAIIIANNVFCENIVSFRNAQLNQDSTLTVDVFLENSDTIAGMQIPIQFSKMHSEFAVDTVIFERSRCAFFDMKHYEILPLQKALFINMIADVEADSIDKFLVPGTGLLCELKLSSVDLDSAPRKVMSFKKGNRLNDKNKSLMRDLRFTIWKRDATEADGIIEPFEFSPER